MDYLKYVMIVGLASLTVAAICCTALWVMAPLILSRARPEEGEHGETAAEPRPPAEPELPGVRFNFTAQQAPALAGILKKESPEDTAVVVSRLPAEAGRALLDALTTERRAKVLQCLASPRTVDLELMRGMKVELENRLYGVVGGAAQAAPFIKLLAYEERKELLETIYSESPARGAELRALFIFDEDLPGIPDRDLGALAAAVPAETMGTYLPALPEALKARLKEQYSGKEGLALQKVALAAPQGPVEKRAALDSFIALVEDMAEKGLIVRPKPQAKQKPAAVPAPDKASAPAVKAPAPAAKPKREWG
ncbi:MAG: hypothetical protein PHV36_08880 [Elusimicrobiales bacterium]|nr:hypothetical protein [Elusimicrobiales bacterium]